MGTVEDVQLKMELFGEISHHKIGPIQEPHGSVNCLLPQYCDLDMVRLCPTRVHVLKLIPILKHQECENNPTVVKVGLLGGN